MQSARGAWTVLATSAAVLVCAGLAWAQADAFADAHAAMMERADLQHEFETIEPPEPPAWLEPLGRFLQAIAPLFRILFWAGVIAVVGLVLYFIANELIRSRFFDRGKKTATSSDEIQVYQPSADRARALLEEADRLANAGRFAEAARHLLHRSIQDIETHRKAPLSLSLTSREISTLDGLSAHARQAFSAIADVVERGVFAARNITGDDYRTCREAYANFALPEAWA